MAQINPTRQDADTRKTRCLEQALNLSPQTGLLFNPTFLPMWREQRRAEESLCMHNASRFNSFRQLHSDCTVEARRLYRQRALVGLYACRKQACRALATSDEDGRPARVAVVLKEGAYHDATRLLYPFIFLHDLGQSLAVLTVRIVEQLKQCVRTPPWPFSGMCLAFSPADISEI